MLKKEIFMLEKLGQALVSRGENILMKQYSKQYGHQIGKISKNGHKAFFKFDKGKEVITGLDRQGNVISKITRDIADVKGNVGSGTIHTERFRDGKLFSVTDVRLATNFRDIFTRYADSSAVRKRLLLNPHGRWHLETSRIASVYSKTSEPAIVTSSKCYNV